MNMRAIPEIAMGMSFILPLNQIPKSMEADEITSRASPHGLVKNAKIALSFWLFIAIEDIELIPTMPESFENAAAKEPLMLMIIRMVHKLMPIPVQQIALFLGFFN